MAYNCAILLTKGDSARTVDRWRTLEVTLRRNATTEWTLTLDDSYGRRNPESANTDPNSHESWLNWLDGSPYNSQKQLRKYLTVSGEDDEGNAISLPALVPKPYGYTLEPKSVQYRHSLSGYGIADRLTFENETQETLVSTSTAQYTMQEVLTDTITTGCGVPSTVTDVDDILVPRVTRQGRGTKALDFMTQLLFATQSHWREDPAGITCYTPTWYEAVTEESGAIAVASQGTVVRQYEFGVDPVRRYSVSVGDAEIFNKVLVQRAQDAGSVLAEEQGGDIELKSLVTLSRRVPVQGVQIRERVQAVGGVLSDFWFYDSTVSEALPVMLMRVRGATPVTVFSTHVDGFVYTFGQITGQTEVSGTYRFEIRAADDSADFCDAETSVTCDYSLTDSLPERYQELSPCPFFATLVAMKTCGWRYILRAKHYQRRVSMTVPLDTGIVPGDWVQIWDPALQVQGYPDVSSVEAEANWTTAPWLEVDSVRHTFAPSYAERQTELSLIQYLPEVLPG